MTSLVAGGFLVHTVPLTFTGRVDNINHRLKGIWMELKDIIELIIREGVQAMPIISTVLLIIVLYFYRKDQHEWREQTREDLQSSIQAIERNTATLERIAELYKLGLERRK
jgi:hypothetical protein